MKSSPLIKLSEFFTKRSRFSVLLILVLITLGFYAYTNTLRREGFPVINIPVVIINTPYFSGDSQKTDKDITQPIYKTIADIEEIKEIQTTSTDKFSSIVVYLQDDVVDTNTIKSDINSKIQALGLKSQTIVTIPNASLIDGENDLVFSIYSDKLTIKELQDKAKLIQIEIEKSDLIKKVNVKEQISLTFDYKSNKEVLLQNAFTRVVTKVDGNLIGYDSINIGLVKKNADIQTIELSESIQSIVNDQLEKEDFNNVSVVYTGDPAISLNKQISSLEGNAIAAIITIFIILLLFINWRSALILALFIPLTLGTVFLTFSILGYTLNTISLFALILVLGLFVDDGTIVVEAIDYYKRKGFKGFDAVKKAIGDIGLADISGTMSTVLVFLPLVSISGTLGDFIKILPLTVIIALLVSLVIALTILPFISANFIVDKDEANTKPEKIFDKIMDYVPTLILKFSKRSGELVKISLNNIYLRVGTVVFALSLIGVGLYYASILPFVFFAPAKDSELISVSISYRQPNTIINSVEKSIEIENLIKNKFNDEVNEIVYFSGNERASTLRITLSPITERELTAGQITNEINAITKDIDGVVLNASIISAGPPAIQYPFAMQIFNKDKATLDQSTQKVREFINTQNLSNDVKIEDVKIDFITDIKSKNNERYAEVKVKFSKNSDSATLLELQKSIENELKESNLVYEFDFGQETENANSFNSVVFAGVLAIFIIYALLVLQFNSFTQPLLILFAIPFSFPGLFPGLYYTNNPMSFFVVIGLTGLIGIVVNNTIMLVEYANSQRRNGKDLIESISSAVGLRVRPILTTTLTTVAGLIPLAIYEPFWEPLAFTIIFGLLSSVVMIIIAFPALYFFVETLREAFHRFIRKLI